MKTAPKFHLYVLDEGQSAGLPATGLETEPLTDPAKVEEPALILLTPGQKVPDRLAPIAVELPADASPAAARELVRVAMGTSQIYEDAYNPPPGKPVGGKSFDSQFGYRTKSMLTVPMRNYNNEVVGAVQLINAKRRFETRLTVDNVVTEVVSFQPDDLEMIESIASQAAVALDNKNLLDSIQALFDGFVQASVTAIEQRDPSPAGHSGRVEGLTASLARAVNEIDTGKYRGVHLTDDQLKELRYACLLHDFGKVGVREHILIKAKKLVPGQLEVIQARFDFIERSVQVKYATEKLEAMKAGRNGSDLQEIDHRLEQELEQLNRWVRSIAAANEPTVMPEDKASVLEFLSQQTYQDMR